MRNYLKQTLTKIGIVATIIFGVICYNNDYMEYKDRKCIVLDKLTSPSGRRNSGDFYLVLKEERGIVFDLRVSPATYSQSKIGKIKYFSLRQFDIKQTAMNNVIYWFGTVFFGILSFVCLIGGWISSKFPLRNSNYLSFVEAC